MAELSTSVVEKAIKELGVVESRIVTCYFAVVIDVYHFDPYSISVIFDEEKKTLDVYGLHLEQVDDHGYATRSFRRRFETFTASKADDRLPEGISVITNPSRFMLIRELLHENDSKKATPYYISPYSRKDEILKGTEKIVSKTSSGLDSLIQEFKIIKSSKTLGLGAASSSTYRASSSPSKEKDSPIQRESRDRKRTSNRPDSPQHKKQRDDEDD